MSNDLISRSALMSRIESERREWLEDYDAEQILGDIEDMPTAYDPDKVVDQLEEKSAYSNTIRNGDVVEFRTIATTKAVEIVKVGGVDE